MGVVAVEALEEVLIEVRVLVDIGILVIVEVEVFETRQSAKSSAPLHEVRPLSEELKFSRVPIESADSIENAADGTETLELVKLELFIVIRIVVLVDVVILVVIDVPVHVKGDDTEIIKSMGCRDGKGGEGSKSSKKSSSELHFDILKMC